jgi:hypothetical protein
MTHTKPQLLTTLNHRVAVRQSYSFFDVIIPVKDCTVEGGFEFREGASAKWIFDVEIEK